eukprot:scaffold103252_cov56-Attheya_sp.AAC.2
MKLFFDIVVMGRKDRKSTLETAFVFLCWTMSARAATMCSLMVSPRELLAVKGKAKQEERVTFSALSRGKRRLGVMILFMPSDVVVVEKESWCLVVLIVMTEPTRRRISSQNSVV